MSQCEILYTSVYVFVSAKRPEDDLGCCFLGAVNLFFVVVVVVEPGLAQDWCSGWLLLVCLAIEPQGFACLCLPSSRVLS